MKLRTLFPIAILLTTTLTGPAFAAAPENKPVTETASKDKDFETLANSYIESLLKLHPEGATQLGDHRYDDQLDDYSRAGVTRDVEFNRSTLEALVRIDPNRLSQTNRIDYRILKNELESQLFQLETLRAWEWNPLTYNVGGAIYGLVARDSAPAEVRLRGVIGRLNAVPAVVAAAKANLKNPPRVHTETAIQQNVGTVSLVHDELGELAAKVPALHDDFVAAQGRALAALDDYGKWLKSDLLPRANGDFRLGDEKFRKKLRYVLDSDLTKEEILKHAEADLAETQARMYTTALELYKKDFPDDKDPAHLADKKHVIKAVLDKLAERHPTNDTIIGLAKDDLAATTEFVRKHDLVTVPSEPVQVAVWPEFSRGVAVASCSPPGVLEKNAKTFYYISPTPADWPAKRVESFFREYDDDMLQEVTIHEAMPGHYLQLAHANQFHAPTLLRAIFQSGTFTEGWATYAEQVMADAGYGGAPVRMQQLKMRLRLIINSIIDQKIHTAGMTEQEAKDLMMNEGFQEEGEAAGKWKRAQLSSTQLSTYYVGNLEMNEIRRLWEKKHGVGKDLKTLHDTMISFGSPAGKYVKEMMGL